MIRHLGSLGLVLTALAASTLVPCRGADPGAAFETPQECIDRDLKPIQAHVQSIKARMERGIGSVSAAGDTPQAALEVHGWASRCCTKSIREVHRRTTTLEKRSVELVKIYEAEGRAEGARLAGELAADAAALRERIEMFAAAPDQTAAFGALQNVVKGVINLNIDRRDLESCCNDIQVPVPPDEVDED
jgi:hypothetical protein